MMTSTKFPGSTSEIPRIGPPSPKVFERTVLRSKYPMVIENALERWPARQRWSPDYFASVSGHRKVTVEEFSDGHCSKDPDRMVTLSMRKYIERLREQDARQERLFLADQPVAEVVPELADDIRCPEFISGLTEPPVLFLGRNCTSQGHYHHKSQAVLCQVLGNKKVVLFSPEDFYACAPYPWYHRKIQFSQIDLLAPDVLDAYPELRKTRPIDLVLAAGEILFIPVHWFHFVYGVDWSVSVTYFWDAKLRDWTFPTPGLRSIPQAMVYFVRKFFGRTPEVKIPRVEVE